MNKTKRSLLTSISSLFSTFVNGLCNLVVIREIIHVYGSDFNGLNSTVTQFINVLLIIEGGFSLAACVALFKPLSTDDKNQINGILSAVNKKFKKIGLIFLAAGMVAALIFTLTIKTELPAYICFVTFLFLLVSTAFRLFYSTKYTVLLQADQKEYISSFVATIFHILSYVGMYIAVKAHVHMLTIRLIVMIFAIGNSIYIGYVCRRGYRYINFRVEPDYQAIKGTNDVFVQKLVGFIYYSVPVISISTFVSTAVASIYAVYNTVFTLLRGVQNSISNAPRTGLGRLISETGVKSEKVKSVFTEYEFCAIFSITGMLSVAMVLIMPFVRIYSASFDSSYTNWTFAVIMTLICFVECIHIPSGNLMNMAGCFKEGKHIQIIAGIILLLTLIPSGLFGGITEILISIFVTAVALAFMEIIFVKWKLVNNTRGFVRSFLINVITAILLISFELSLNLDAVIATFVEFFAVAIVITVVNFSVLYGANFLLNREVTRKVTNRFLGLICRRKG